ncbi:MAG: hypothetical protein KKC11_07335 [Candidatus Omnitrophica bacterium]|nr:hypothetical protein [Candidatus Omnitrophota bacterium]MBU1134024.1 hypothetical protein [Candidatus Omnitrophota bacterium]MBU1810847.1 hypothetical protein [Candidatus Omnitrophota bacterium]MBU2504965.1 hypothetical protein [Candidatus Omnitrophota bacterium]
MKGLDEIHQIMEEIYDEEKNLASEERIKRIRQESERFLKERNVNLKRILLREKKHILQFRGRFT